MKKSILKKWWFWVIVVMVIGALGSAIRDDDTDDINSLSSPKGSVTEKLTEIPSETVKPTEAPSETVELVSYEIIEKGDVSYGNVKRYDWLVVITEQVTKKQLEAVAIQITEQAMNEIKFNALSIGFYDYEEYIAQGAYTLGSVVFAPQGDWGKADTVNSGEFDKMLYNMEALRDKNWDMQLTQEEVKLYKAWYDLLDLKGDTVEESEIDEEIAKQFEMEKEEVEAIIMKQIMWIFQSN